MPDRVVSEAEIALDALVMTPTDARFDKNLGKPLWTLAWITNALQDPWRFPGRAETIMRAVEAREPDALWQLSAGMMELEPVPSVNASSTPETITIDLAISNWVSRLDDISADLNEAFSELTPEERVYLAASILAPAFATEDDPAFRPLLESAGMPRAVQERVEAESDTLDGTANAKAWLELVKKIDRSALHRTGCEFTRALRTLSSDLAGFKSWPDSVQRIETKHGVIFIGTIHPDRYESAVLLIIDPGGDDVYSGSAGAANGLLAHPFSAVIDFEGRDRYESNYVIGPGAAVWGVACLLDLRGDDEYRVDGVGLGSGLFGAAWQEDADGRDYYQARVFAQGAGIAGFGFQIDRGGDDIYDLGHQGQGFSGVMGWGLLVDEAGHDRYAAGRVLKDHERNDDRFLSLAQGFSIGMRPHAGGGVAALVDLRGNDTYHADVYGQGVSYYYSAGFLLDGGGNDMYAMHQYGQGCAVHMSLGLLADASGSDIYSGFILAQGAAHDYSAAFLFDHDGDDTYTADHHAQGRALNNSFALLVDRSGTDGYFARQRTEAQGIGNGGGFRDYGSMGLLMDLRGADIYSGGMSSNMTTLRPLYGVVHDREAADEK